MKKIYSFFIAMAMIATCASAAKAGITTTYAGTIDITMMDQPLAEDSPANVQITATDEGTCTFMLPDFEVALTPGAQPMPLGDIVVENVSMTTENGTTSYEGAVEDLVLSMAGMMDIHASVEISGTTTDAGAANMTINVIWNADYPENTQQSDFRRLLEGGQIIRFFDTRKGRKALRPFFPKCAAGIAAHTFAYQQPLKALAVRAATRPKMMQSATATVPRRTMPWTPPVTSPAA